MRPAPDESPAEVWESRTRVPACVVALLLGAVSAQAWGQAEARRDPIAAEALFERGKQLIDQGHTPEACRAFAESQRLDPAGGTLLRLALCHEAEGKLASAWLEFLEVVRVSKEGTGEPAKLAERVRLAREHLGAVEPRVPKLTVSVRQEAKVPGLLVTANELPRNEGSWGVPIPTDPGDVTIVAGAPSRRPYRATIHLAEGQQLAIEVPPLEPEAAVLSPPQAPAPMETTRASALRPIGVAVGAAGVVALGVGTYFGVLAASKSHDANQTCPGTACPSPAGVSLEQDAQQAARIADITLAAGLVAVTVGVTLYLVGAPPSVQARGSGVAVAF